MNLGTEKISVIVPVYKIEKYIDDCIESILGQTYTNFELILVDDGSPDNCGMICDKYRKQDARIQVIHKQNGGLSDARNAGLKVAVGEYITFVDGDDMVSEKYLEIMYQAAKYYQADIVQGEFADNKDELGKKQDRTTIVYTREEALNHYLQQNMVEVIACAKLYSKKCFSNVEYPKGRINEDNLTTYKNIWKANKLVCIPNFIYYYRLNPNSIMQSGFSAKRFEILSFQKEIENYLGIDASSFKNSIDYAEMRIALRLINDCITSRKDTELSSEMEHAQTIVKEYSPDKSICEPKYLFLSWLVKHNYWLYRQIIRIFR